MTMARNTSIADVTETAGKTGHVANMGTKVTSESVTKYMQF